jgi:hypothetical protein
MQGERGHATVLLERAERTPPRAHDPPQTRPLPPRRLISGPAPCPLRRRPDPDLSFALRALARGDVTDAVLDRSFAQLEREVDRGGPHHLSQLLVRDGHLTVAQFVEITDDLRRPIYECPRCGVLHRRAQLDRAGRVTCRGCRAELDARGAELSRLEILVSHDPRELSVVLRELPGG